MDRPDWQRFAACQGDGSWLYFDGPHDEAKAVCSRCPVKTECLDYAVEDLAILGVWGGTTERQRRWLRQQRRSTGQMPAYPRQTQRWPPARLRSCWATGCPYGERMATLRPPSSESGLDGQTAGRVADLALCAFQVRHR